ncbi:MAG: hypothetical protein J3K34DRAFT_428952 [Monoraphidium minutum]|nr:MAG: hypothetical protein J3K34DRAFT_428952 [Monoraphidium minutum]
MQALSVQQLQQRQPRLPTCGRRAPLALRHAPCRPAAPAAAMGSGDGAYTGAYSSNLGALARTVAPEAQTYEIDPYQQQRVSVESFANRGYAIDGGTAFVNGALLLLLFALAFERIFGLDKVINDALRRWKESRVEARRYEVLDARERLEQQWGPGDGDGAPPGGSGGGDGGRGGGAPPGAGR